MQVVAFILTLLASVTDVLLLAISAYIIATAALHPHLQALALAITAVRACGLFRAVFRYGERYVSHSAAFQFSEAINIRFYNYAVRILPLKGQQNDGYFIHRLNKAALIWRNFYLRGITVPVVNLILIIITTAILFPLVNKFSFMLFSCYIFSILLPYWSDRYKRSLSKFYADYRNTLIDFQQGLAEIKNSGQENYFLQKLNEKANFIGLINKKQSKIALLANYGVKLYNAFIFLCFFYLLLLLCIEDKITGVELAVLTICLEAVLGQLSNLQDSVEAVMESMGNREFFKNAEKEKAVDKRINLSEKIILSVDKLNFSYIKEIPVLNNISFQVKKAEKVALIGDSGAGKTTLFYLLLGLWKPDSGDIKWQTEDITASTQGNYIFNCSIRDNFRLLYPNITDEEIYQALAIAQLKEIAFNLPNGLSTIMGENGNRFSGGQRQRFLVSLALAAKTDVILLDEPTCGLDRMTAEKLMQSILSFYSDKTIIIITHDAYVAEYMERCIKI